MKDMKMLVWLLPILFILHDMEEIIFVQSWKEREKGFHKYCLKRIIPFGTTTTTSDCAIGVYEELLMLTIVSLGCLIFNRYGLWFGIMVANLIHLIVMHIVGTILMYRRYVPGLITAFLTVGPCIYVLVLAERLLGYRIEEIVIYVLLGSAIAFINLKVLHMYAYRFSKWIKE